jgi:hypothetical protein
MIPVPGSQIVRAAVVVAVGLAVTLGVGSCTETEDDVASLAAQGVTSVPSGDVPSGGASEAGDGSRRSGAPGAGGEGTEGTASDVGEESISLAEARERQSKTADAFYSCLVAAVS